MTLNEKPHNENNYIKKQPQFKETTKWIFDNFWITKITQIYDWWPNILVPSGLFFNEISSKIFEYLKWKWNKFYLDAEKKTEQWYSSYRNKYVFLWLRTPHSYTKNMWLADSMDEDIKTQLVFLHEMCHHIARELEDNCESFRKLFHICRSLREKRPNDGISGLWDMSFYQAKWINTQATEDCTELLRIYFMCRNDKTMCYKYIKKRLHLNDETACITIFNLLEESVMQLFPWQ